MGTIPIEHPRDSVRGVTRVKPIGVGIGIMVTILGHHKLHVPCASPLGLR